MLSGFPMLLHAQLDAPTSGCIHYSGTFADTVALRIDVQAEKLAFTSSYLISWKVLSTKVESFPQSFEPA